MEWCTMVAIVSQIESILRIVSSRHYVLLSNKSTNYDLWWLEWKWYESYRLEREMMSHTHHLSIALKRLSAFCMRVSRTNFSEFPRRSFFQSSTNRIIRTPRAVFFRVKRTDGPLYQSFTKVSLEFRGRPFLEVHGRPNQGPCFKGLNHMNI